MKKNFIKAISFFTLLILLFISLNSIFINKVGHRAKIYAGAYDKSIKYDVAFIGSSHMNSSLSPYILWENYGITSYNLGTGGQPLDVSYYLLKELLKNHSDLKVVVVDLYYAGLTDPYGSEGYIRYVLDNMKLSSNKIDAIKNCTPKNERLYYLFPLLKYHTRWKELRENDFKFNYDASRYDKGFSAARGAYGSDNLGDTTTEEIGEIPEKTEEYIYKFINL